MLENGWEKTLLSDAEISHVKYIHKLQWILTEEEFILRAQAKFSWESRDDEIALLKSMLAEKEVAFNDLHELLEDYLD